MAKYYETKPEVPHRKMRCNRQVQRSRSIKKNFIISCRSRDLGGTLRKAMMQMARKENLGKSSRVTRVKLVYPRKLKGCEYVEAFSPASLR